MWKNIAKKVSFTKKKGAAGSTDSKPDASEKGPVSEGLERKGSAALGPFSMDEFAQLEHLHKYVHHITHKLQKYCITP